MPVHGAAAIARVAIAQQKSHKDCRVDSGTERVRLPRRQDHHLPGPEPARADWHPDFHIAFQALNRAFIVDVMLRLVPARRQYQMQQLQTLGFQQASADGLARGDAVGSDADDVEQLSMRQSHECLQSLGARIECSVRLLSRARVAPGAVAAHQLLGRPVAVRCEPGRWHASPDVFTWIIVAVAIVLIGAAIFFSGHAGRWPTGRGRAHHADVNGARRHWRW